MKRFRPVVTLPLVLLFHIFRLTGLRNALYFAGGAGVLGTLTTLFGWYGLPLFLLIWIVADRYFSPHTITRNFPIVGWGRFILEKIGPELRQYIVASNNEELPFNRDQRTWIYASAKKQNNLSSFGSDNDLEKPGQLTILPSNFPHPEVEHGRVGGSPHYKIPCAKIVGGWRNRQKKFRPDAVGVSSMSFGSLGRVAVQALNRGCHLAGCLHWTGEGGVSPYHLEGAEIVWQIGTGYFGARAEDGSFSMERFRETVQKHPQIKMIEIKLSQGAKPGKGGILPGEKVTPLIAEIRGVPVGEDCVSPNQHTAFHDANSLIDFIESLAEASGLPVGIKSAVGQMEFWHELASQMKARGRGPDFITIDGGEGGTGAAPFLTADHVGIPFKRAFARVYKIFVEHELRDKIVWIGSGKLGTPEAALLAFSLGCDMVIMAREALMSIGCIQAQICSTGHCPTGIATHSEWLMAGLDPTEKGPRNANYLVNLRKEILTGCHCMGVAHPAFVTPDLIEFEGQGYKALTAAEIFGYEPKWSLPAADDISLLNEILSQSAMAV